MEESTPCQKGGMRLSEALDNMQLAYNPITKQLHFVSPKVEKTREDVSDDIDKLSKKSSFSDEGNFSLSTCEKSDTSDSPKSTLQWGVLSGHQRGKDGGSFSSTVSSLSECSLGSAASKDDDIPDASTSEHEAKLKKKGLSGFFSRGVFPWKNSSKNHDSTPISWKLFGSKSQANLSTKALSAETQKNLTPASSVANTPHHHRRQGSSASEKQFEDLVASSIALIQHDRPSNLPAKCTEEALRHKAEHARMVEAARRRVEREAAARLARVQQSLRLEERLARHAREWTQILPDWQNQKNAKRTLELWWSGLPPAIRGRVWQLAIDNKLRITHDHYQHLVDKAKHKLEEAQLRRKRLKIYKQCPCSNDALTSNFTEKALKIDKQCPCSNDELTPNFTDNALKINKECSCSNELTSTFTEKALKTKKQCQCSNELTTNLTDKALKINKECQCSNELSPNITDKALKINKDCSCSNELTPTFTEKALKTNKQCPCSNELTPTFTEKALKTNKQCPRSNEESTHKAKTNDDIKERLTIPRNYSEQNLKSQAAESEDSNIRSQSPCCSKSNPNLLEYSDECSMELIQLDIARTFPHLCIFQPGGPYFNVLHELLAAYVCYRPDIGYIQGMSFIAAVLILNMEAPQAFVCFANLLDGPVLRAAFTRDGAAMQRLWKAYTTLLRHNLPSVADTIAPELYLLEWLYTAFAKAMPLDATCRVWDLFLRDGDTFLFNTALGILHLYQEELKDMDFISAAQFLTKLPEDLDPEALFRSISSVSMTLDGMSFEELASSCQLDGTLDDDIRL